MDRVGGANERLEHGPHAVAQTFGVVSAFERDQDLSSSAIFRTIDARAPNPAPVTPIPPRGSLT
jgi:hypothetical protein